MKRVLALAWVATACTSGTGRRTRLGEEICARLADRLEVRLRAHESDLPLLRAWAVDELTKTRHLLTPTVNDAAASHRVLDAVAPECSLDAVPRACAATTPSFVLGDPEGSLRRMRLLLDGLRGRGPCARPDPTGRQRADCGAMEIFLRISPDEVDRVREGSSTPFDTEGHMTRYASEAAETMARWRALVDYGLALAPICAPRAADSCVRLRDGLPDIGPDELVARLRALDAAFRTGTSCPSTTGAGRGPS